MVMVDLQEGAPSAQRSLCSDGVVVGGGSGGGGSGTETFKNVLQVQNVRYVVILLCCWWWW